MAKHNTEGKMYTCIFYYISPSLMDGTSKGVTFASDDLATFVLDGPP